MITTAIINVTSYTGVELLRLLSLHPQFRVTSVTARSSPGKQLDEVFPQLRSILSAKDNHVINVDPSLLISEEPERTELAFGCLPHGAAATMVVELLEYGTKVVDLSADFRLREANVYEAWYAHTHPAPGLLDSVVFGLPERYRERIKEAQLVANPGCYATAAILALLPAYAAGIIDPDVIIDAKSGVSGAGRGLTMNTHFAEANEDVSAYSTGGHRHLPEITQELMAGAAASGNALRQPPRITFIPHLMPMTRGILATCYANLRQREYGGIPGANEVRSLYESYYDNEPFVHVVDQPPHTKWTYGTNHCFIYPTVDTRTGRLLIFSCLDNLVKGAAGQAIQNANMLFGLPETAGLSAVSVYP